MEKCSVVKCVKTFVDRSKYPFIKFPRVGLMYMVRDVVHHQDGGLSYKLYEIRNETYLGPNGPVEPSFNAGNFDIVRKPVDADKLINKALKNKD